MMGQDIETIITCIDSLKTELGSQVIALSGASSYLISVSSDDHKEVEVKSPASSYMSGIISLNETFTVEVNKLKNIESEMYTSASSFNNSCGSPWTEIYNFSDYIDSCKSYASSNSNLESIGKKLSLMNMLQTAASYAVDAKNSILTYNDYIQRAYDHLYNGNEPSITWESFSSGETIGNVANSHTGNVNLPVGSEDPY